MEQVFFGSAPKTGAPEPLVSEFPSLPVPARRTPSPERLALSRALFTMLFGGIALLLGAAVVVTLVRVIAQKLG